MFCSNCGKAIQGEAKFCPYCGVQTDWDEEEMQQDQPVYPSEPMEPYSPPIWEQEEPFDSQEPVKSLKCPCCGSRNLQITTESTTTTGGGYSGTAGCLGFLLLGPCGLLCGNCGNSQTITTNKNFWICQNCGYKFRNLQELEKEMNQMKTMESLNLIGGGIAFVLGLLFLSLGNDGASVGIMFVSLGVVNLIIGILLAFKSKSDSENYEELKKNAMG